MAGRGPSGRPDRCRSQLWTARDGQAGSCATLRLEDRSRAADPVEAVVGTVVRVGRILDGGTIQLMDGRRVVFRSDAKGRTVIPAALRAEAGISEEGDTLVGYVEDGRLVIEPRAAVKQRLRARAEASRRDGVVERLLADRRADLDVEDQARSDRRAR